MTTRQIPSEEQVIEWMDTLSNWGRWVTTISWAR